ncbi:hypothetical protein E2C01_013249 [Portunus trituberculatus]|uniref:Secreted protein n=1 Tax=Portunus trituberculatus TaxID=210409 RepID=A0A5B7DFR9_PORTR|nr:hypothetical protein [Portunus trituberculatus]
MPVIAVTVLALLLKCGIIKDSNEMLSKNYRLAKPLPGCHLHSTPSRYPVSHIARPHLSANSGSVLD